MRFNLADLDNGLYEKSILNEEIQLKINKLVTDLGITILPEVKKTKRIKTDNKLDKSDTWVKTKVPTFKATIINEKTGSDKYLSKIKACLNKLCFQNYDTEKELIIKLINKIIELDGNNYNKNIIDIFIDISCTNQFYCKFYIKLLQELFIIHTNFQNIFLEYDIINVYTKSLKNIHYIDSDEDYNQYCKNNKENDYRKGMCICIIELIKQRVYDEDNIYSLFLHLINLLKENEDNVEYVHINDEIIDNINNLLMNSSDIINEQEYLNDIKATVNIYKTSTTNKGITTRSKFKFMDIWDKCLV